MLIELYKPNYPHQVWLSGSYDVFKKTDERKGARWLSDERKGASWLCRFRSTLTLLVPLLSKSLQIELTH